MIGSEHAKFVSENKKRREETPGSETKKKKKLKDRTRDSENKKKRLETARLRNGDLR